MLCDLPKFLRNAREIDDLDRIKRRASSNSSSIAARATVAGTSIPISMSERSPAERDPNRTTRYAVSGTCRRITEAANLAASAGCRIAYMRGHLTPKT